MIRFYVKVVGIATTVFLGVPTVAEAATLSYQGETLEPQPLIVAGDPNGDPPITPDDLIDPNTPESPYGGVGSLRLFSPGQGSYRCSGSAIHPQVILTAAHCLDINDGGDGDGIIDFSPQNVTFNLNFAGDYSQTIEAENLAVHPDWQGFATTLSSDLALITLSETLPEAVPIYELVRNPLFPIPGESEITMVGYGQKGDGIEGQQSGTSSWTKKRVGYNLTDDPALLETWTPNTEEMFLFDFDAPDGSLTELDEWNLARSGITTSSLGNDLEAMIAPGDSGGPSFLTVDEELQLLGVNSLIIPFSLPKGSFGTVGGGVLLSPENKLSWIDQTLASLPSEESKSVPEPGLWLGLSAIAALGFFCKKQN